MRCTDCGHDNREGARFCDSCGAELGAVEASTAVDSATDLGLSRDFVGRQQEMGELAACLEDALSGRGRMVMLAGEPGIGKTRTAQELAAHAERRGAQVWWGRCYEGEGAPPYWPWVQPIRSYVHQKDAEQLRSEMGPGAADIAEFVPEVRERLPDLKPSPALEPEEARFRLFDSITTFLKNVSRTQPLVFVLDDLHWADASSLLLLEFLAREIVQCPLLLIGTYRDIEVSRRHPLSRTLGSLMREHPFQRVQLRGLTQQDVGRFVETAAGVVPSAALVEEVHGRTEGNPLFLGELVGLLTPEEVQEGRWSARGIPEGVRDAIGRRLDRLSQDCNHTLTMASVIGREFDFRLLVALSQDTDESQLLELVDEALEAGVIEDIPGSSERYHFSHALIQQTLAEELSTSRRVRLHARIGEALEKLHGTDVEAHAAELAHHFAEAEAVVGPEKLVHYCLLAGERALAAYGWDEALTHFEHGLAAKEGHPMDEQAAMLLFGLGRAQMATAQTAARVSLTRAFDYYAEVQNVPSAVDVVQALPPGGRLLGMTHLTSRALEMVAPDSLEAGRMLPRHGLDVGRSEGDYAGAQEAFSRALTIARREDHTALEMRTLANAADVDVYHLHFQEAFDGSLKVIEMAQRGDDPYAEALARFRASMCLLRKGDVGEAGRHAAAGLVTAERLGDKYRLSNALLTNEIAAYLGGDLEVAISFSDRALALGALSPTRIGTARLARRASMEFERGNVKQGEAYMDLLLEEMRPFDARPTMEDMTAAIQIGLMALSADSGKGLDAAEATAETVLSADNATPLQIEGARVALGLIAVSRKDADMAREQYAALESHADAMLPYDSVSADRLLGLLAHTMGNLDDAVAHFEDALAFCRKAGYRPELAWSCHDYADALLQRNGAGDHQKAMSLLEESQAISTELGMRPLMERVTDLQERAESVPAKAPAYPDGLTQREVEVLRLIAAGKSNQEIADALVISVNTVFRHVSNIFSKTGASNRTEAATYATRHGMVS